MFSIKNKVNFFFSLFLFVLTHTVVGQTAQKSWIIQNSNNLKDTLYGEIQVNSFTNLKKIRFKRTNTSDFQEYTPAQVHSFFANNHYYESREVQYDNASPNRNAMNKQEYKEEWIKEPVFLKVLVRGKLNFYYFSTTHQHLFVQKNNEALVYLRNYSDFKNDKLLEKKIYQQQLQELTQDCAAIDFQTLTTTSFSTNDIQKLIVNYNVCSQQQQYEANPLKTKFVVGAVAGIGAMQLAINNPNNTVKRFEGQSFEMGITPIVGLSCLIVLPTERQRIMIYNEIGYRTLNTTSTGIADYINASFYSVVKADINVQQLRTLHGLRYVLNKSSAIRYFVEGGFGTYFSLSSEDKRLVTVMMGNSAPPIIRNEALFEKGELQSPQFLFWGGAGISYKKLSTGLRYEYQPALLNLSGMTSPIHTIGWTVGYHFNSF